MKNLSTLLGSAVLLISSMSFVQAMDGVVVSIKPIHSLVAGVMAGIGSPEIIVDGAASPHAYSLKPSQARIVQKAKLVFWVGEDLETFLAKPMQTLGGNARIVELADLDILEKIGFREGGAFEDHGHEEHDKKDEDHDHKSDHADDHEGHEEFDPHIWLDPENAKIIVSEISRVLSEEDPQNAGGYMSNAEVIITKLNDLSDNIATTLQPVSDHPFVVFHDAYRYFEERFGLNAVGSLTVNPDVIPGAARISELRQKITELGAVCIFSEPQFSSSIVGVLTEGTNARASVLDPIGAGIEKGPNLYFQLMENMSGSFEDCLSKSS